MNVITGEWARKGVKGRFLDVVKDNKKVYIKD